MACGVLLLHLQGREWRAASRPFARLEALLGGLVSHYGLDVWPVAYVNHVEFEKYRSARAGGREDEEGMLSSQSETSTLAYVSTAMPPEA